MELPDNAWPLAGIVALVVVAGLAGITGLVVLFEEKLIFFPSRTLEAAPSDLGLEYEEVSLETEDGFRLHGWFLPVSGPDRGGGPAATILYCHGNAGNVSHRLGLAKRMQVELGADVLLFDYRGYGLSAGTASEAGTYRDARAAYRYLVSERRVAPEQIVLFGESLGAAVALALANEVPSGALVLEAPFTSIADMARAVYPWLPVTSLLRTRYDNLGKISGLRVPLLVVHGTRDATVPFEQGRRLYERAPEPKRFLAVPGAGHSDAAAVGGESYWAALRELLLTSSDR